MTSNLEQWTLIGEKKREIKLLHLSGVLRLGHNPPIPELFKGDLGILIPIDLIECPEGVCVVEFQTERP